MKLIPCVQVSEVCGWMQPAGDPAAVAWQSLHLCIAMMSRTMPCFSAASHPNSAKEQEVSVAGTSSLSALKGLWVGFVFQDSSRDIREALHELLCCTNVSTKEGIHLALVELLKNLTKYPTDRESIWK